MDSIKKPTEKITVSDNIQLPKIKIEKYETKGWTFIFQKSGILPSNDLDQLVDRLKLQGIPDIVYGQSHALLVNESKNFVYAISPADSLSFVNFEKRAAKFSTTFDKSEDLEIINVLPGELKIKQAEHWKNKKIAEDADIKELAKISDWTYSSPYKGTVGELKPKSKNLESIEIQAEMENLSLEDKKSNIYIQGTEDSIPLKNLTQDNPIKWFNEFLLYEDELGDCGLAQSTFRFRTMADCFFGLLRFYLRVDDVCIRIYDTRIYHEFGKDEILREFSARENSYDELKKKGFKFTAEFNTDPRQADLVYQNLDVQSIFKDKVIF